METIIIPIIKDKKGSVTDKNNYRPIAITSVISKVVELLMLSRLQGQLNTACNKYSENAKSCKALVIMYIINKCILFTFS